VRFLDSDDRSVQCSGGGALDEGVMMVSISDGSEVKCRVTQGKKRQDEAKLQDTTRRCELYIRHHEDYPHYSSRNIFDTNINITLRAVKYGTNEDPNND
jgi:hypothetical protein